MALRQPRGKVRALLVTLRSYDAELVEQLMVVLRECPEVDLSRSKRVNPPRGIRRATFLIVFVEKIDVMPFRQMLHEKLSEILIYSS